MDIKISELADVSELTSDSVSPTSQSGTTKKFSMAQLANYILNIFNGLSFAGATQTVKSAIDAIHNKIGTTSMGTEATTVTGAIAEHGNAIDGVSADVLTLLTRPNPFAIISTEIQANTDVNTLDTPGNYYCSGGTVAATLTNAPITNSSFQMLVFGYAGQQRFEVAWQNAVRTRVFYRSRTDTGEWGDWYSITRNYDFDPVGTVTTQRAAASGNRSITAATMTNLTSITLPAGKYVVNAHANFQAASSSTTYRIVGIGATSSDTDFALVEIPALPSHNTILTTSRLFNLGSSTTLYLNVQVGTTCNVVLSKCIIEAIRIK